MNKLTTILIAFLFTCFSMAAKSQASSSSDFQLRVEFPRSTPVKNIEVGYFKNGGNRFEHISFITDNRTNTITIRGHNHYILWVAFPLLVFTVNTTAKEPVIFYLVSDGPLSSYTGKQVKPFKFTMQKKVMVAWLQTHNHKNAHESLTVQMLVDKKTIEAYIPKDSTLVPVEKQ